MAWKSYISGQIGNLGTNVLIVTPGAELSGGSQNNASSGGSSSFGAGRSGAGTGGGGSTLTVNDYNSLINQKENPDIASVTATVSGSGIYGAGFVPRRRDGKDILYVAGERKGWYCKYK